MKDTRTKAQLKEHLSTLQETFIRIRAENEQLKHQVKERIDTSMIDSRIKLASQLGQMMEAFTRAIGYIVAKETL